MMMKKSKESVTENDELFMNKKRVSLSCNSWIQMSLLNFDKTFSFPIIIKQLFRTKKYARAEKYSGRRWSDKTCFSQVSGYFSLMDEGRVSLSFSLLLASWNGNSFSTATDNWSQRKESQKQLTLPCEKNVIIGVVYIYILASKMWMCSLPAVCFEGECIDDASDRFRCLRLRLQVHQPVCIKKLVWFSSKSCRKLTSRQSKDRHQSHYWGRDCSHCMI